MLGPSSLALGNRHLALLGLRWFLVMLMLFDIGQNAGFFAKLVKTAEGFLERFVIANFNACQLLNTSFTAL
jgi:hypothetical protein